MVRAARCDAHDRLRHAVLLAQVDVALAVERLALRVGVRARRAGGRARLERASGEDGCCQHHDATSLRALSWWRGEEFSRVHVIRFTVYPSECDKRVTRRVRFECIYENV